jgi:hypothetical protein
VDDSAEVREVQSPNNGRDPFPILLRRQQLPKVLAGLGEAQDTPKYTWRDLQVGATISILGRRFLVRDVDAYTRAFYGAHLPGARTEAIPMPEEPVRAVHVETPPYNGYGSVEDSLGSCKYLVLKPPKKDFMKALENEHKVLRFVARIESKYPEDRDRRFVLTYLLADDTMSIFEPPQRNAGILGGKFMERTRVLQPGSSLSDARGPVYYEAAHLFLGAELEILRRKFVILNADEYVFNHYEALPAAKRPVHSDRAAVLARAREVLGAEARARLAAALAGKDVLPRKAVLEAADGLLAAALGPHVRCFLFLWSCAPEHFILTAI